MIKIMIDSGADCKNTEIYDITVPMAVNIDGREYHDGVDLQTDEFYNMLIKTEDFPRTSQPSPEDFLKHFEEIKANGDELICFSISSGLSGTYQSANIAKTMVDYDGIYIIDTKTVSHMIELLAKYARDLISEGFCAEEIVEKCENVKKRIRIFAGLDTLEYLKRGGRIGKAAAFAGKIANLKPIITVSEGTVDVAGKALGVTKAIQAICEKAGSFEIDPLFPVSSLYTYGEENCIKLEEKLAAENVSVSSRLQIGPTIGAHVGPGVYGIFFVEKE